MVKRGLLRNFVMSRRPVTITICPSGASAGDVHQSCIVFMFLKKSAGRVLARGTAYKPRSFAGPSVIYLSSLPPGIGRAARWSRSSLPVYLTLQPARCAACHIAVASGGLLPRLFTLAVGLRWAGWAVVFCHVADSSPKGVRCSLLPGLSSRASFVRERRTRCPGAGTRARAMVFYT